MRINLRLKFSLLGLVSSVSMLTAQLTQSENYVSSKVHIDKGDEQNPRPPIQSVTYFDGLGRAKQNIVVKGTSSGLDLVTPIAYDEFGRQHLDILPFPKATNNAGYHGVLDQGSANAYYQSIGLGGSAYSEKILEASPLDRIMEQYSPGESWRSNAKSNKFEYLTNTDNEVKLYTATYNYLTSEARLDITDYYPANTLYKNVIKDEDGNVTIEFKNGEGQTILVRKQEGSAISAQGLLAPVNPPIDTYYVYNNYNQLAYVIPPLAVVANNTLPTTLDNLCYQYKYDTKNRLVEKKLPGKGKEEMVYDKADRLVLTQDAKMHLEGKWLFTKYDMFGRVAYTGLLNSPADRIAQQNAVNNMPQYETRGGTGSGVDLNGITLDYSSNAYPANNYVLLSVSYYDTYPTGTPFPSSTEIYGQTMLTNTASETNNYRSTQSLALASFVKNIESDDWTKTYSFYDNKGRVIGTSSINYLGGFTKVFSKLSFSGLPEKTKTSHKKKPRESPISIEEEFVYDKLNRLTHHYHTVVGKTPKELLTYNIYDDLGRLTEKKLGGANEYSPLETTKYNYNIRGWMTGINLNPQNAFNLDEAKLFSYKIKYNDPVGNNNEPKFNGNISEIDWSFSGSKNRYQYYYDHLNRLSRADYKSIVDGTTTIDTNFYGEQINYDANGNIKYLKRFAKPVSGMTADKIDDLVYTYEGGSNLSNRLSTIKDNSGKGRGYPSVTIPTPIGYDANGNMTNMLDKGISNIAYNYLNLPNNIVQRGNTTLYNYRADGTKVFKTVTLGSTTLDTYYLDGFVYTTNYSEEIELALRQEDESTRSFSSAGQEDTFDLVAKIPDIPQVGQTSSPEFFPTAEGFYDYKNSKYIYQYKDHLGNVRLSYSKNSSTDGIEVEDTNNYYPFGLSFIDLADNQASFFSPSTAYQNYKYNGKELQETGMYDYGARFYMPDAVRWMSPDPLSEEFSDWSPYNYAFNNPLRFTDPDGNAPEDTIETGCCPDPPVNDVDVAWEFTEMIAGGINSVRASVSNLVARTVNVFTGDKINNKYEVENGSLVLVTGVPKESGREKAVNTVGDLATIGLAALGGPQGALTAQGGKAPLLKAVQEVKNTITGHTRHGLNQSINRNGGKGVNINSKLDAIKNPKSVVQQSGGRTKYTGKTATVITNKEGKVVTTYGKSRNPSGASPQGRPTGGGKAQRRTEEATGTNYNPKMIR